MPSVGFCEWMLDDARGPQVVHKSEVVFAVRLGDFPSCRPHVVTWVADMQPAQGELAVRQWVGAHVVFQSDDQSLSVAGAINHGFRLDRNLQSELDF